MLPVLMAILVLVSILTILAALVRSMMGIWLDYRARIVALDRLVDDPDTTASLEEVKAFVDTEGATSRASRGRGRMMTGAFMIWFGIGSIVAGRVLRSGAIAVGLDLGGWSAVLIGLMTLLLGWIAWRFSGSHGTKEWTPPPSVNI